MNTDSLGRPLPGAPLKDAFSLTSPSTWSFSMPSWDGSVRFIGGGIQEVDDVLYDGYHAVVDPLVKAPAAIEDYTAKTIKDGYQSVSARVSSAFSAVENTASAAASGILSPLSSGLKWGIAVVVVGVALYAFAIFSPLLPRPSGSK